MFGFASGGAATAGGFNGGVISFHPTDFGHGGIIMGSKTIGGVTQSGDANGAGSTTSIDFKFTPPPPKQAASGAAAAGTAAGGLMNLLQDQVYGLTYVPNPRLPRGIALIL